MTHRVHLSDRDFTRAGFLGVSASVLVAAGALAAHGADLIPMRVGASSTDATAGAFYGLDQGLYKAAGLDVTITANRNTGALAAALSAGSLDVIVGSIVPIAQAVQSGIDLRTIAPGQVYDGGPTQAPMAVTNGSKIVNGAGLAGKTVAVNGLRDLSHLFAVAWIDANGGDSTTVKIVEIPFPAMTAALVEGRVDAAQLVEPFASAARGKVTLLNDSMPAIGSHYMVTGMFSKLTWLDANRDTARRFASATLRANAWANGHHDESAVVLSRYTQIPADAVRSMARATYGVVPVTPAIVQPVLDGMTKYFKTQRLVAVDLLWSG